MTKSNNKMVRIALRGLPKHSQYLKRLARQEKVPQAEIGRRAIENYYEDNYRK